MPLANSIGITIANVMQSPVTCLIDSTQYSRQDMPSPTSPSSMVSRARAYFADLGLRPRIHRIAMAAGNLPRPSSLSPLAGCISETASRTTYSLTHHFHFPQLPRHRRLIPSNWVSLGKRNGVFNTPRAAPRWSTASFVETSISCAIGELVGSSNMGKRNTSRCRNFAVSWSSSTLGGRNREKD